MIDGKSFIEKDFEMSPLDYEIKDLVYLINQIDGVETVESCFGHHEVPCRIWLRIKDIEIANKFMKQYFYFDSCWRLVLTFDETNDYKDELLFALESKYQDFPTVDLMVDNLIYRFKDKYRGENE